MNDGYFLYDETCLDQDAILLSVEDICHSASMADASCQFNTLISGQMFIEAHEDELSHHGILGQRWGIRRFQNPDGSLTPAGKERYGSDSKLIGGGKKELSNDDRKQHDYSRIGMDVFSVGAGAGILGLNYVTATTQGYYMPQTVASAAIMIGVGTADLASGTVGTIKGNAKKKKYDKEREGEEIDKATGFHKKANTMTIEEDMVRVNPLVGNFDMSTKKNCMLCSSTYDMRRRGYDVEADIAKYGYETKATKDWYPNAKLKDTTKDTIISELAKQGNGARGNMMFLYADGSGGHCVSYEVIDNKPVIIDAQIGKKYDDASKYLEQAGMNITYARLDNVKFDPKKIKEVCK